MQKGCLHTYTRCPTQAELVQEKDTACHLIQCIFYSSVSLLYTVCLSICTEDSLHFWLELLTLLGKTRWNERYWDILQSRGHVIHGFQVNKGNNMAWMWKTNTGYTLAYVLFIYTACKISLSRSTLTSVWYYVRLSYHYIIFMYIELQCAFNTIALYTTFSSLQTLLHMYIFNQQTLVPFVLCTKWWYRLHKGDSLHNMVLFYETLKVKTQKIPCKFPFLEQISNKIRSEKRL